MGRDRVQTVLMLGVSRPSRLRAARRRWLLASVLLVFGALGPGAQLASASTTTINFETPALSGSTSPQAGSLLGSYSQFASDGVQFASYFSPIESEIPGEPCGGELYRDDANAHSGDQVGFSFCGPEGENEFSNANISGQILNAATGLGSLTDSISVYAGAPKVTINGIKYGGGGQLTTLTGYNTDGGVVKTDSATVGTKAATLLSITSSSTDIAYFTVSGPGDASAPLEIDDLSFEVPATPPPPQIALNPVAVGFTTGSQAQTLEVPVTIDRYSGADDPVTLAISGLPDGVTLTGGQTIAAGSDSTDLTFSIAANAQVTSSTYTLKASTADAATVSEQGTFTVTAGLVLTLSQSSISAAACSATTITVYTQQYVPGTLSLSVSPQGNTSGLSDSLSTISNGEATLKLASNGTGGSGTATYKFTLSDANVTPVTATLVVNRVGLTAQGIYVTQGTQPDPSDHDLIPSGTAESGYPYQGVTLVANKQTVVRLYADATGSPAVSGLLYGYQDGKPLPGSPLQPDYGPLDSSNNPEATLPPAAAAGGEVVPDSELESNANAYTFTLPNSWTFATLPASPIQLVGQVAPTGGVLTSGCHANDSFTLNDVPFSEVGNSFNSVIYPLAMTVNGVFPPNPGQVFQDAEAATPIAAAQFVVLPYLASVNITGVANTTQGPCGLNPSATAVYSQDPLNSSASETAGQACANIKDADVLNLVESFAQGYQGGEFNGPHVVGVNLGVARGLTNGVPGQYSVVDGTSNYRPLTSVTHELFHQFGLQHASAACGGAGVTWPPDQQGYLDGIGLNTTSEPYQFIAAGSPDFASPLSAQAYDLMSYCAHAGGDDPNTWISPRNWSQLISNFGINCCDAADVWQQALSRFGLHRSEQPDLAGVVRARTQAADPLAAIASVDPARLSVIGFVTAGGVAITNVGPQVGPASPSGTPADSFTLTARGANGQLLADVPMVGTTGGHIDGAAPEPLAQISGEVPVSGVQSIQIENNGQVVASRVRPARAPRVSFLSPRAGAVVGARRTVLVKWRSTNPEHLALTAMLDYSRDGGHTWRTVYVGPDTGRAVLRSFFLTATRRARLRVRVNDGFNESVAVSGRFVALGAPPQVTIWTRITRGLRISGAARVQLSGQAIDQAAQVLSGRSLRWFDGSTLLGVGSAISAGPLPAGVNRIRLLARDSAGRTGSATLTVRVSPVRLPFLTLEIPRSVYRYSKLLTFRAAASVPAILQIDRHSFRLARKLKRFSFRIGSSGASLLLACRVTANGIATPFVVRTTRS